MSLDRITNATDEQKSAAFEWLRKRALHGGQTWFHAAVLVTELVKLNEQRPEGAPHWEKAPDEASEKYINAAPGRPVWFINGDGQVWIYHLPPLPQIESS